jgi:hypothetical protein
MLMPRQRKKAARTQMKLPETIRELARIVGQGDMTNGVEQLFAQLPVFYRIQLYLGQRVQDGDATAESLLRDMEGLEISRIHTEAVCEGIIVPGENGESAAWIV